MTNLKVLRFGPFLMSLLKDFTDYFWYYMSRILTEMSEAIEKTFTKFPSLLMHLKSRKKRCHSQFPLCNLNICRKSD